MTSVNLSKLHGFNFKGAFDYGDYKIDHLQLLILSLIVETIKLIIF